MPLLRGWALAAALLGAAAPLNAQDAVSDFKKKFLPEEQAVLGGVLTENALRSEFEADAAGTADPAVMLKWRARAAEFSADYLSRSHPIIMNPVDAQGTPIPQERINIRHLVERAEWGCLMAVIKVLGNGGLVDQAKAAWIANQIEKVNGDLARGDYRSAHTLVDQARGELVDSMRKYVASEAGRTALAENRRVAEARAREAHAARLAQEARQAAARRPPTPPAAARPGTKNPAAPGDGDALAQLGGAAREGESAQGAPTPEGASSEAGKSPDGSAAGGPPPATPVGGAPADPSASAGLRPSGERPTVTVRPGVPAPETEEDGDLSEIRRIGKKAAGSKAIIAAGAGGLLGALIGLLVGGPIGLLIGAAGGALLGYAAAKFVWG